MAAMAAVLKIYFSLLLLNRMANRLDRKHWGDSLIKSSYNCSGLKSKMAAMAAILKIYFFTFSPESKGQLTWNLNGSIGVTCRSKIAKSFQPEIQDGCHGGHLKNLFFASSPELKCQFTWNLVGSMGMTNQKCKMAAMLAVLKIYFSLLLLNRKLNWLETWKEESGWLVSNNSSWMLEQIDSQLGRNHREEVDQKELKSFQSEIQDGHHGGHLENLFFASSPEPKGQLTWNLVGSIGETCRSKIVKIVPIWNPSWPPWRPSWKSIFASSP